MTQEKKQKMVERIQKLFAMGSETSGATKGEMENAIKLANNLLTKFNISISEVERLTRKKSDSGGSIEKAGIRTTKCHDWHVTLIMAICDAFDVKWFYSPGWGRACWGEGKYKECVVSF